MKYFPLVGGGGGGLFIDMVHLLPRVKPGESLRPKDQIEFCHENYTSSIIIIVNFDRDTSVTSPYPIWYGYIFQFNFLFSLNTLHDA